MDIYFIFRYVYSNSSNIFHDAYKVKYNSRILSRITDCLK